MAAFARLSAPFATSTAARARFVRSRRSGSGYDHDGGGTSVHNHRRRRCRRRHRRRVVDKSSAAKRRWTRRVTAAFSTLGTEQRRASALLKE